MLVDDRALWKVEAAEILLMSSMTIYDDLSLLRHIPNCHCRPAPLRAPTYRFRVSFRPWWAFPLRLRHAAGGNVEEERGGGYAVPSGGTTQSCILA